MIDPAWEGDVKFYELVFGTWMAYAFLVLMWEKLLRKPLDEWRYVSISLAGAAAFWINHYFQGAPFYSVLLNAYTVVFLVLYYYVGAAGEARSIMWKAGVLASAVAFTVAFILFENIARLAVARGLHEFWMMLAALAGFAWLIAWRGPLQSGKN